MDHLVEEFELGFKKLAVFWKSLEEVVQFGLGNHLAYFRYHILISCCEVKRCLLEHIWMDTPSFKHGCLGDGITIEDNLLVIAHLLNFGQTLSQ